MSLAKQLQLATSITTLTLCKGNLETRFYSTKRAHSTVLRTEHSSIDSSQNNALIAETLAPTTLLHHPATTQTFSPLLQRAYLGF